MALQGHFLFKMKIAKKWNKTIALWYTKYV